MYNFYKALTSVPQFGQPDAQFCQAPLSGPPDEAFIPMEDAAYFPIGMAIEKMKDDEMPFFFGQVVQGFLNQPVYVLLDTAIFGTLRQRRHAVDRQIRDFRVMDDVLLYPLVVFFLVIAFPFKGIVNTGHHLPFDITRLGQVKFKNTSARRSMSRRDSFFNGLIIAVILFDLFFDER